MSHSPARAPWLVAVPVAGETVVYDPIRDALHLLDRSATAVWALLDGRTPTADVIAALARRHGEDDAVGDDVRALLGSLESSGLVSVAGSPGPDRPFADSSTPPPTPRKPATPIVAGHVAAFAALDHHFTVTADDPELEAVAVDMLRDLAGTTAADPVRYRLRAVGEDVAIEVDGEPVAAPVTPERVPHLLLWHINQEAVRRSIGDHVILHAAVAERDGRAVVLPAAMERGKTTTVAGLVRAGFRYLSDELAVIDPATLHLRAYPKPLGIDPGAQDVLADLKPPGPRVPGAAWQVPASTVRPDAVALRAQPAVIVAPEYNEHVPTAIDPMAPGRAVVHLADCTFGFREHPARDLRALARLAEACDCYRLTVNDLDEAVKLIDLAAMRSSPGSRSVQGR